MAASDSAPLGGGVIANIESRSSRKTHRDRALMGHVLRKVKQAGTGLTDLRHEGKKL